jgi:Domain of unknown function (DUF4189)
MTRSAIFRFALVCMTVVAIVRANAASAVANDGHGHTIYSTGQPTREIAIQHALLPARQRYGTDARIVAATDVTGYSAIAVGNKGKNDSVLGVTLGRASREEAEKRAIEICLKAGGSHPVVRWEWYG